MNLRRIKPIEIIAFLLLFSTQYSNAQVTTQWGPDGYVKIENNSGGFVADLQGGDRFSRDHDQAGDINNDGIIDLVVGVRSDDDGATDAGAVYILFMNIDGTVQSNQKISATEGGFTGNLSAGDFFGYGVAGIGDYDNDNIPDIAVTALGRIYIIHLNNDGTVKDFVENQNINSQGLSAIGDLDNDGRVDLVACQPTSNAGGTQRGAIKILFFDHTSNVINSSTVTISSTQGGFGTGLQDNDRFGGREVAMLGDIDNDGTKELAVGAFMSDGGKGAIWILSLDNISFNVVSKVKITEGLNGFTDPLTDSANPNGTSGASFGHALCKVGDLNGDGVPDLMTGANQQNEGWGYILYLNADKTVKTFTRINNTDGGFGLVLDPEERFSRSISFIGDLRGDGTIAVNYGGGAGGTGTLYLMFFKPCDFIQEGEFNRWSGGNNLFSNWNHNTQSLTSDALTFEQCTFKAFETDAAHMTYNAADGRCICKDVGATLAASTEMSTAFTNECFSGSLLPIELTKFAVEVKGREVRLYWQTAFEQSSDYFMIEHSTDGRVYTALGKVKASGTSHVLVDYEFVDDNPFNGLNYYRLKQQDLDGTIYDHGIVAANFKDATNETLLVFPNPARSALVIETLQTSFTAQDKFEIFSLLGEQLHTSPINSQRTIIDLSNYPQGTYFLATSIDGQRKTFKIWKE